VLWDLFTGSAPYREVLTNTLHPGFIVHIVWNLVIGMLPGVGWKSGIAGIGEGREKDERATDY
jgi:hypothetical protein